jgi:uncharacterized protein YkwD
MSRSQTFFGLLLIVLAMAPASVPVLTPVVCCPAPCPTKKKPTLKTPEMQVITLVNQERTKRGLKPLTPSPKLMAVSEDWSQTQANRRRMYHSRNGYGENVAVGQPNSYAVMNDWMHSRGHRKNILSQQYDSIGVGYVVASNGRPYWTQSFQ